MQKIVASGYWCEQCEMFEVEDIDAQEWCPACGCGRADHIEVDIITEGSA